MWVLSCILGLIRRVITSVDVGVGIPMGSPYPWEWDGNGSQIFPVGSPYGSPCGNPYDRRGGSKVKVVCQKFYRGCMQDLMAISAATLVGHLRFPHIQIGVITIQKKVVSKMPYLA